MKQAYNPVFLTKRCDHRSAMAARMEVRTCY